MEKKVALITGVTGQDSTIQKVLDVSRMNEEGWSAEIGLREGVETTLLWMTKNQVEARK